MPFCKVCYDAKRPESEYTNHYVKDQPGGKGIIVCPTLLNQACRICHNTGHTSSYCPQYRRRNEEYRREEPRREEYRREEYRRDDRDYRRPRVRLNLEAPALYASKHAETDNSVIPSIPAFDVLAINLGHVNLWGDENVEPFFLDSDPVKMCDEFINSFK